MADVAFSLELNRSITAKQAVKEVLLGNISNRRAFVCANEKCKCKLTLANWTCIKKKNYFTNSSLRGRHVAGCKYETELSDSITVTIDDSLYNLNKDTILDFSKSKPPFLVEKKNDEINDYKYDDKIEVNDKINNVQSRVINSIEVSKLIKLVSFFKYSLANNINPRVRNMDNKLIRTNKFFINVDNYKYDKKINSNRIYYGKAKVFNDSNKPGQLILEFVGINSMKVYSNVGRVKMGNPHFTSLDEYLNTDKELMLFLNVTLYKKSDSFSYKPCSEKTYEDIYVEEIR